MPYEISQLRVRNFKCFDSKKFYTFSFCKDRNPTILSGPNGFGKTTFFDAIELIFTNKITRLQTSIEDGRINLGKNILLNEADKDGNLVLTLIDENKNYLTVIAIINNQVQKLFIEESIKYNLFDGTLNSDNDIDTFIGSTHEWKSSLHEFEKLRYSLEHFNVYYYVSQAESVHFLKNSISNRKDSMNVLLKTTIVNEYIEYITNQLIGKSRSKKGVLINDEITSTEEIIKSKVTLLKSKIQGSILNSKKVKYSQLLEYPVGVNPLAWDAENPDVGLEIDLNSTILEVEALHRLVINLEDYKTYLRNQKIRDLSSDDATISDFIDFYRYIENGLIRKERVIEIIDNWNKLVDIYNHSTFFRNQLDIVNFKKEDISKLKEIDSELITVNIEELGDLVASIKECEKSLSNRQTILNDLDKARSRLQKLNMEFNRESSNCPFCNHKFTNVEELEQAFASVSSTLSEEKSDGSQKLQSLTNSLHSKMRKDLSTILSIVQGYDDKKIRDLNALISKHRKFVDNENRIKAVEIIFSYLGDLGSWSELEINEKSLEIQRDLLGHLKDYSNPDFVSDMDKYHFSKLYDNYRSVLSIPQSRITSKTQVEQKIQYLQYKNSIARNIEITTLKDEIKNEILKVNRLGNIRDNFERLQKIYESSINDYKNQILKKLKVPLLIYTGKILQDYQNGLGVFVNKDEMRFVSNGDAKHDILNTFSSGQLSGFVLAFLFSMNKQYITKSTDDIGFILVDDPVQTMDDINISSLIEVLRNDFSNKQIIISTHETDKENYILYKFIKYNLIGQSFNVKEELYT